MHMDIVWGYLGAFSIGYQVLRCLSKRYLTTWFRETHHDIVAAYLVSMCHVHGVILFGIARYIYNDPGLMMQCGAFTVAYFVFDSLFIVFRNLSDSMYLIHHGVAVCLALCVAKGHIDANIAAEYSLMMEASNYFLSLWELCRQNKQHTTYVTQVLYPLFAATYVPIRAFYVPYGTYMMITHTYDHHVIVWASLSFICVMSMYCSWRVICMTKYTIATLRTTCDFGNRLYDMILNHSTQIMLYIVFMYFTMYHMIIETISPLACAIIMFDNLHNMLHVMSLMYNSNTTLFSYAYVGKHLAIALAFVQLLRSWYGQGYVYYMLAVYCISNHNTIIGSIANTCVSISILTLLARVN